MKSTIMNRNKRHTIPGILLAPLAAVILAACAASAPRSEVVIDRAKARWDAVIAQEYENAYNYYSPGYRSSVSLVDYEFRMRKRRVVYSDAQYVSHHCEESRCTLSFQVGYGINRPLPGVGTWDNKKLMVETWVRSDGNWWYLPEEG